MKHKLIVAAFVLVGICIVRLHADEPQRSAISQEHIAVYFSPNGGCTDAIVTEIAKATKTIELQAYSFTSAPIAKSILEAKKRGVQITAILDKSQRTEKYSSATFLHNQDVPVFIDARHAIAHNKIILIDGRTIITGSFNFTRAAEEKNAENLLIISDRPDLYVAYEQHFQEHLAHSLLYDVPDPSPASAPRAPPTTAPADAGDDVTVYVTRTGHSYHTQNCGYLRKSSIPMKLSQAKAAGYAPCSRCNPPH